MKLFITTLAFVIAIANSSFAGSGTPSPVNFPKTLSNTLKVEKTLFEADAAKVCACQILRVSSKNESETLIAVFAQGTNDGDLSADINSATSVLEKEKKHLKGLFYDKVQTTDNLSAPTRCSVLYKEIQTKYSHVKLYDVLDADALNNRHIAGR